LFNFREPPSFFTFSDETGVVAVATDDAPSSGAAAGVAAAGGEDTLATDDEGSSGDAAGVAAAGGEDTLATDDAGSSGDAAGVAAAGFEDDGADDPVTSAFSGCSSSKFEKSRNSLGTTSVRSGPHLTPKFEFFVMSCCNASNFACKV
jgi:hypothetical protein